MYSTNIFELWESRDKTGLLSKTPWSAEIYTQTACYRIRTVMRTPRSMASEYWAQPGGGGRRSGEKRGYKSQSRVEVDTEKGSIQPKKKPGNIRNRDKSKGQPGAVS